MCRNCLPKKPKTETRFKPGGPLANIGPVPERDLDTISLRIYIKDGKLDQVVPESPWEGQVDIQVVYQSFPGKLSLCKEDKCPEGPDVHWHDWMSVAVFRATKS